MALVAEAAELGAFSVCVSPSRLPLQVPDALVVCTVIGFPSGAHASSVKAAEAAHAVEQGATEVDMVIDLGRARAGDWAAVEADVAAVAAACGDALLKVIVESAALSSEQLVEACRASERGGGKNTHLLRLGADQKPAHGDAGDHRHTRHRAQHR